MDIYAFAKQFETDGRAYYLQLAASSADEYLVQLFTMLAEDEQRHYEIISRFQEQNAGYMPSESFKAIRNIFQDHLAVEKAFDAEITNLEAYAHAVELEKESFDFYRQYAEKAASPEERDILLKLANEEKKHEITLTNLMDLVRKPEVWVESAEFSNLEAYDYFTGRDVY